MENEKKPVCSSPFLEDDHRGRLLDEQNKQKIISKTQVWISTVRPLCRLTQEQQTKLCLTFKSRSEFRN